MTRIVVIGAGAMGCLYGGRLAVAGHEVTLVDLWQEHVEALSRSGLLLESARGEERIPIAATTDPRPRGPFDLAIILVDANATRDAAKLARDVLAPDGFAVTLQNGIGNLEAMLEELGDDRVVGGLSYHSAALAGPGRVKHTHTAKTWLGELNGGSTARLDELVRAFRDAGLDPEPVPDIRAFIWEKWVLNCAINPISAITGLRQGEIPRTPPVEEFQTRIIEEILAVLSAKEVALSDPDIKETIKAQCWKKFNKPSMLQHVEAGKRTEIDALNGAVVRLGRELGVPVPYNEALTMLIKGLEKSQMQKLRAPRIDYDDMEARAKVEPRPR